MTTTVTNMTPSHASPFNDPTRFSDAIDNELHQPAAAKLSELAQRILKVLAAPGALGGGVTFSVIEVVAGLKLRTSDWELGSVYWEVVNFLCNVCRLDEKQTQIIPVSKAEEYLKYFSSLPTDQDAADEEIDDLLALAKDTHDADAADVRAHDEANQLFGSSIVTGTEPTLETGSPTS